MTYDEAYQPIIEDGRGRFPEDVRFKAPRGLRQAIAKAAELDHTTQAEWTRRALLDSLSAKGGCDADRYRSRIREDIEPRTHERFPRVRPLLLWHTAA
jgi:hypothetical protein